MRALILLASLAVPASGVAQPPPQRALGQHAGADRIDCVAATMRHAGPAPSRPLQKRRLDQLPPGQVYLSVVREVDGCQHWVLASEERDRLRR